MTEQLTIDTPEQIALDYALAGLGSRCLALALDTLFQSAAMLVLVLAIVGIGALETALGATPGVWPVAVGLLCAFVLFYGYFALFEWAWRGQTPGKRIVGLRVISASGHPVTAQACLLRNLVRIADSMPGFYAFGVITMFITARSQRLGDLAAGTVVVHERSIPADRYSLGPVTTRVGGARLRPEEFEVIETFLRRRDELHWVVREETATAIATRMRRSLQLPVGGSDEELLEQVASEYRAGRAYR